jgi:predicted DNA-binding WGR domain protein
MKRFETATRYYLCTAQQDLFGHWEVFRAWGAKGSALGNSLREPADDEAHAQQLLARVLQERAARGYVAVPATEGERNDD